MTCSNLSSSTSMRQWKHNIVTIKEEIWHQFCGGYLLEYVQKLEMIPSSPNYLNRFLLNVSSNRIAECFSLNLQEACSNQKKICTEFTLKNNWLYKQFVTEQTFFTTWLWIVLGQQSRKLNIRHLETSENWNPTFLSCDIQWDSMN